MNLLFLTVSPTWLQLLQDQDLHVAFRPTLNWKVIAIGNPEQESFAAAVLPEALAQCDILLLDTMGCSKGFLQQWQIVFQQGPFQTMSLHGTVFIAHDRSTWISGYWKQCDSTAARQLLTFIAQDYAPGFNGPTLCAPQAPDYPRIQWPGKDAHWTDWKSYTQSVNNPGTLPRITLLYSSHRYPVDTWPAVADLCAAFSGLAEVVPIATPRLDNDCLPAFCKCYPSNNALIINLLSFRLGQGPTGGDSHSCEQWLQSTGKPLLHPFFMTRRSIEQWQLDPRGTLPGEFMISLFLPEMDGAIETIPCGALYSDVDHQAPVLRGIPDRMTKVVQRSLRWIKLAHKRNANKRIAIMLYDYPPGQGNLGHAAFLDTIGSLCQILARMKENDYLCEVPEPTALNEKISRMVHAVTAAEATWLQHPCALQTIAKWGSFPGEIYRYEDGVAIAGWQNGNVLIGVQPPRKKGIVSALDYHDGHSPPHHHYLATYRWLDESFAADALLHLGTHGTLEFTPGKENAPSQNCFPDFLVGNMPHVYVYYSGNPSEAMIAKRRSHAVLIGHMPAPVVPSGLYGNLQDLRALCDEYAQAANMSPARQNAIAESIASQASRTGLATQPEALHAQLEEMEHALIPARLHILGQPYSEMESAEFSKHGKFNASVLQQNNEIEALLQVLDGKYLPVGLAGDPLRNPEVLPTGRNLIQFDPRHVPSPAASRLGQEQARANIDAYFAKHKRYPQKIAVILWGLETAKTQGETIAQILYYIGVELLRTMHNQYSLRLVPISDLGRPRIDVQIQISGFLRDLFPNMIELLDEAFTMVADASFENDHNPIAAHSKLLLQQLLADGTDHASARDLANVRIFGPAPGLYGTAVTGIVNEAQWQNEQQIATSYLHSMRHVYTRTRHGEVQPQLLAHALRNVEMVSQVRSGHDYEVTDLDHYYEYLGGIQSAIRSLGSPDPEMRVCDSVNGTARSETLAHSIQRGTRTRLLNPLWQQGMLATPIHGAQQLSSRMENLVGLAALTHQVDTGLIDDVAKSLVLNQELFKRITNNNPHSAQEIAGRLLELSERGLWNADEPTLQTIADALLDGENE